MASLLTPPPLKKKPVQPTLPEASGVNRKRMLIVVRISAAFWAVVYALVAGFGVWLGWGLLSRTSFPRLLAVGIILIAAMLGSGLGVRLSRLILLQTILDLPKKQT